MSEDNRKLILCEIRELDDRGNVIDDGYHERVIAMTPVDAASWLSDRITEHAESRRFRHTIDELPVV